MKVLSKKNLRVEITRLIACLLVIWYHLRESAWKNIGELSEAIVAFECICGMSVVVFFIISGFFIYGKKGNIFKDWVDILIKFIKNIYVPFLLLAIISIIFQDFFIGAATISTCIKNIDVNNICTSLISSIKNYNVESLPGTSAHFWYIYSYLTILIVYPITRTILTKFPKIIVYIIFVAFVIYMAINDYNVFYNNYTYDFLFKMIKKPIFYSTFGHILYNDILKKYIDSKIDKQLIINKLLFAIAIIVYFVFLILLFKTQSAYYMGTNGIYVYASWLSLYSMILAVAFITFFYNINFENVLSVKIQNIIYYLASKTLDIYLIHYFVTTMFFGYQLKQYILYNKPTIIHQLLHYFILVSIVFAITMLIIIIIDCIKNIIYSFINRVLKKA